tara:strand:- start:4492 stop:5598 length:1107 start_codon:yes stop_codon:yes gene_type:complete
VIKFLDLKEINQQYEKDLKDAFSRVINSGWYILGKELDLFESEFAEYCQSKHCIGVASGLDALILTLKAMKILGKIKEGDEVIVPANTFIATIIAITETGLKPVLVDPNELSYNIDPIEVKKKISRKTKIIIPVHLYGRIAPMQELKKIADDHKILILEDAAQAHGSELDGKKAGSFGEAAGFSFYPGKNLGALGDAGAIITSNTKLFEVIHSLRNYGSQKTYFNKYIGINSRMDEMQAAFLRVKLKKLENEIERRREIANKYLTYISNEHITLPNNDDEKSHVWHLFVIRTKNRSKLQDYLLSNKIETRIHYPIPTFAQECYLEHKLENCDLTKQLSEEIVSLPMGLHLSDEDVHEVINCINNYRYD